MSIKMKGLDNTTEAIRRRGDVIAQSLLEAIRAEAQDIMMESLKQVPRDTGFLANTQFQRKERGSLSVVLGYSADYALFVHEAPPSTQFQVGKRKFLEDPVKAAAEGYTRRLAQRMKDIAARKGAKI